MLECSVCRRSLDAADALECDECEAVLCGDCAEHDVCMVFCPPCHQAAAPVPADLDLFEGDEAEPDHEA